jgi:hypothetical protein
MRQAARRVAGNLSRMKAMTMKMNDGDLYRSRLHDEMVLAAMKGFLANPDYVAESAERWLPKKAYDLADAMLKERKRRSARRGEGN